MAIAIQLSLLGKGRGAVVMVVQSVLPKSSPCLGKAGCGGHGHIGPSFQKLSPSAGKEKGWWSWSCSFLFLELKGVVVMVIELSLLEKGRGNGHGHTQPSSKKLSSSSWTI